MAYSFDQLVKLGISFEDARALRRISMTLHRWHELECGDGDNHGSWCIARGSKTGNVFEYADDGKPFIEYHSNTQPKASYRAIADKENGALKRLAAIMKNYPSLSAFVQTDPRGCALYIGHNLTDTNYNQGIPVYK